MDDLEFLMLEYIRKQKEPINGKTMREELAADFGGQHIVNNYLSKVLNREIIDHITYLPIGKFEQIYLAEFTKRQSEKFVSELEFDKLSKEVAAFEVKLDKLKPDNIRANIAIAISAILLIVELVRCSQGR